MHGHYHSFTHAVVRGAGYTLGRDAMRSIEGAFGWLGMVALVLGFFAWLLLRRSR
jgi:hypothetical protein